ncbi:hypothetical protein [Escherichia coli]|uniref:hypothetical protein n=1 Tax=Escherichia coli TaxID=562 RepID=UPI0010CC2639|nr:hypothetical protein [Escherichia coli]GDQ62415.1 hypothetical protein BvCmsNSP045_00762 [Escherichia coli]
MRRVIFYSVETFVDDTRARYPWEVPEAMIYTPPLMRKYRYVNFNRVFVPMREALLALRGELKNNLRLV